VEHVLDTGLRTLDIASDPTDAVSTSAMGDAVVDAILSLS